MKAEPLKLVNKNPEVYPATHPGACHGHRNTSYYETCKDVNQATHIRLHFPGPLPNRIIPVSTKTKESGSWFWNGDTEKPTITPSIISRGEDENGFHVCHSFVTDGKNTFSI